MESYAARVFSRLSALPQEIRLVLVERSHAVVFSSAAEVEDYLKKPQLRPDSPTQSFLYQVTFSDGTDFEREVTDLDALKELNHALRRLGDHVRGLHIEAPKN